MIFSLLILADHPFLNKKRTSFCFNKNYLNRLWKSVSAIRLGLPTFQSFCAKYSYHIVSNTIRQLQEVSGSSRMISNMFSQVSINLWSLGSPITQLGSRENCQKLLETAGNYRKLPETTGNYRKLPETAGNCRKQPETMQ